MKTVFFGNRTVGVIVLQQLLKETELLAVFAHPDHPDDGIPSYQYTGAAGV